MTPETCAFGEPVGEVIDVQPDGLPAIPLWSRRPLAGAEWLKDAVPSPVFPAPHRRSAPPLAMASQASHSVSPK